MANPEHLKVVRKGRAGIAAWRKQNPTGQLDLHGADLQGVDLHGADLRDAYLRDADLSGANLREADLNDADLGDADLGDADLRAANLSGANLRGTYMSDADLCEANLDAAILSGAYLRGANLRECTCVGSVFGNLDLSEVMGLDSVQHRGPSTVGIDALFNSKGKICEAFLRGCGLRDWEIEAAKLYNPTLTASQISDIQYRVFDLRADSPIQISSLFISYTHADCAFVDALEGKLIEQGIRFWRDVHHATSGPLDKIVDRAMRLNPTVVLVLSEDSVESDWVEDEVDRARKLEKELKHPVLCPVALDDAWKDCAWSRPLRTQIKKFNVLPFHSWQDPTAFEGMFRRLIEGLALFY
jgi:uncharacterized protein YjbI with pentapeptide repeats